MEHSFNIDLAMEYGIDEAIIIQNMFFWIRHNVANRKNFNDGRYWTYNTTKAMQELFPYMTESKISRCICKLVEMGVVIKGNYNKQPFDRTCWYAFNDKFVCKLQNLGMDLFKMKNGDQQNEETIPYNIPYSKQDINKESTNVDKKETIDFDFIKSEWERICPTLSSIRGFNVKRKTAIVNTLKNNNATVDDMIKCFKIISISEFCKGNNKQQWKATFDWIISDTKSCFNRLLEGEFTKNGNEKYEYDKIINNKVNVPNNKPLIINGIEYK